MFPSAVRDRRGTFGPLSALGFPDLHDLAVPLFPPFHAFHPVRLQIPDVRYAEDVFRDIPQPFQQVGRAGKFLSRDRGITAFLLETLKGDGRGFAFVWHVGRVDRVREGQVAQI